MRVLIVSPHFPPVNAPDMQRVRMSLPTFVARDWDVTVLTVDDPTPMAPVEVELSATVPDQVRVVRARCCSRTWTALIGLNNVALRSLPFLFFRGCRELAGRRYDVVYFSTTMFIVLPLGRVWKALYRVPYVIDLQDPWVTDFYDRPDAPRPPGDWKYRIADVIGRLLEGWTMRGAARLIAVSKGYLDTLRSRYPETNHTPGIELPFGSPDSDLDQLRKNAAAQSTLPVVGTRLAFAGAIGPGMLPAVELLFAAIAEVRQIRPDLSVHFFGTSYSGQISGPSATDTLAERHNLRSVVHEQTERLGYLDALRITLEADVNLLFGSTDLDFVPSKIMALLAAQKPVLAIAPEGSALVTRLASLGQTCVVFPSSRPPLIAIQEIVQLLSRFRPNPTPIPLSHTARRWSSSAIADLQLEELRAASRTA